MFKKRYQINLQVKPVTSGSGLTTMKLAISKNKTIRDLQLEFSSCYPFLKLEFYKSTGDNLTSGIRKHLEHSVSLPSAGLAKTGELELKDEMTVEELEQIFLQRFGLLVQVSRQSGFVWLETTMTDGWSLWKQNEYGREITLGVKKAV